MTLPWVVHGLVISVLLFVSGLALEGCARNLRVPVRWVWSACLAGSLALIGALPFRDTPTLPGGAVALAAPSQPAGTEAVEESGLRVLLGQMRARAQSTVHAPLRFVVERMDGPLVRRADQAMALLWIGASLCMLAVFLATLVRFRAARRGWPERELAGQWVRVAPGAGPAVVGILRPEVVVPAWLLRARPEDQALVMAHEREHLRARDHWLLAFGCAAIVLLPWNPCVWWMAGRLRLGVELDCDERVLRSGAPAQRYGRMLVDMAAGRAAVVFGAAALADSPSHLERRLLAMTRGAPRVAVTRNAVLICAALLLGLAACEAELPSAAELDEMGIAEIEEKTAAVADGASMDAGPRYIIDGVPADREAAHALSPETIARVNVLKPAQEGAGATVIEILTLAGAERRADVERAPERTVAVRSPGNVVSAVDSEFSGLLFIDGQRADPARLRLLSPESIERVEVLKGAAAARLHDEPEAQNGVIHIYTKNGGGK